MIEKIDEFINCLDTTSAKNYARNYFNIVFTDDELNKCLPFIKVYWKDYLNVNTRQLFLNQLTVATTQETTNKIVCIINKLLRLYNITNI